MIPKGCKRLAEVDFPIAEVSRHAVREKSIRHGHPSTLHLWWARRPLASSRAILLGLLLPDPCDLLCPREFKDEARKLLPRVGGCNPGTTDKDLRKALLTFIGSFANWDVAANRTYLEVSQALVSAAHGEERPLVADPFAGGGSIPLEALRLGCETFASDLNPVACLILKVILEDIPRMGPTLAEELRVMAAAIKEEAKQELEDFYPKGTDGATPIAYLWARTVRCESPNCGAEIPLMRSLWLCKKGKRKRALRHRVVRSATAPPLIELEVFSPKAMDEVSRGTVSLAKATCPACNLVLSPVRVRAQLAEQSGGADAVFDETGRRTGGARLLVVVELRDNEPGRHYRTPGEHDHAAIRSASAAIQEVRARQGPSGLGEIPHEPTPQDGTGSVGGGYRTRKYGIRCFGDFFTARQQLVLVWLVQRIASEPDGPAKRALTLALGKTVMQLNSECRWKATGESLMDAFGRQALPIVWDFAEASPFSDSTGDFWVAIEWILRVIDRRPHSPLVGQVQMADATESPLPEESVSVFFTDPPYYDSVPYADLSDFFFVWLRRALGETAILKDRWDPSNALTPKLREAVRDEQIHLDGRPKKDAGWYERKVGAAFGEGRRVLRPDGVAAIVFAHKTTEGWEALLTGLVGAGWTLTASWPIATEMSSRLRARESAALATSVHLVCRPRPNDAQVGDWADVLRELPIRVGDWMERLQGEGVRGADLVFACIGPALEIFSRYSKVETADGRELTLAEYLEKVWEVVGRSALGQVLGTAEARARNGAAGAVEEDARLTALFLWTLQSTDGESEDSPDGEEEELPDEGDDEEGSSRGKAKGYTLVFDVVRRFAQPLGIELPQWEGRVIETKKGVVRLLPIAERAKQLFGEDGAQAVAERLERQAVVGTNPLQGMLFPEMDSAPRVRGRGRGRDKRAATEVTDDGLATARGATTLDRVHAAMLLQAGGRTNALRALLKAEQERGPDFLRLANALSALYPKSSDEKRLLDAMLLGAPR